MLALRLVLPADGEGDAVADGAGATFAQLLKRLRLDAGLTQEELAEAAGVSARSVSDLERGVNRTARKDTARLIADALGLSGATRELFEATARGREPASEQDGPPDPGRLPVPLTPLVGRADDIRIASGLLRRSDVRLVTITGLGGVGKTRMALEIGRLLRAAFPDGVHFVNLASVRDPALVMAAIAHATGVRDSGSSPLRQRVASSLRPSRSLLVMDNFEQVADAAGEVSALLGVCPDVKCLVTSRCALRLQGEHEYVLIPLQSPPAASDNAAELMRFPAVELFSQRVQAVLPGWEMDEVSAPAVGEICRRLDGLPLALELAAARTKILAPVALLDRLDDQHALLSRGTRDADDRHQTLQATLDWSYDLLDSAAALLFPRLSVFAGGWTLDALVDVCGTGGEMQILDAFATLVDSSLVWRTGRSGTPRFTLPVTIREYAAAKLRHDGSRDVVGRRHLAWFLGLAETAAAELTASSQMQWLQVLADEHANLRAALEYAITVRDSDSAHRLATALWRYWEINGHLAEGRKWFSLVLELSDPVHPAIRAHAFRAAGNLARDQGDFDAALKSQQRALVLFNAVGDGAGAAAALNNMAIVELDRGEVEAAVAHFEASLQGFTEAGEEWGIALLLCNLSRALRTGSELARAEEMARKSILAFERLGDPRGTARSLAQLGLILGRNAQLTESLRLQTRSAALFQQIGDRAGLARSLESVAWVQARLGNPGAAAWLLGHAEKLRAEVGEPVNADDRLEYEETVALVRSALEPDEEAAFRSAGRDAPLTAAPHLIGIQQPAADE